MNISYNENFNQMAAALAHEVKNPVALIKANVELIEENDSMGCCGSNIEVIKKQLRKISSIVTDFIQLTKNEEKGDREQVFIYDLITDITEEYDISLKGKNITFGIKAQDYDINIFASYNKLSILFYNIYKNAVEAIKDKGCITTNIEQNEDIVTIRIDDNGVGIDSAIENRLFEPFVTTKKDGSGLGLAICRSIAQEYGGEFGIKNRSCGGCEVTVSFKVG